MLTTKNCVNYSMVMTFRQIVYCGFFWVLSSFFASCADKGSSDAQNFGQSEAMGTELVLAEKLLSDFKTCFEQSEQNCESVDGCVLSEVPGSAKMTQKCLSKEAQILRNQTRSPLSPMICIRSSAAQSGCVTGGLRVAVFKTVPGMTNNFNGLADIEKRLQNKNNWNLAGIAQKLQGNMDFYQQTANSNTGKPQSRNTPKAPNGGSKAPPQEECNILFDPNC